jgi:predicted RecA/RadA family phage recombinase
MRNFVSPGKVVTVLAPYALVSGAGALVGVIFGVASAPAASGASVNLSRLGVFTLPKATGAITQGAALYWDNTAKNLTTTSAGNTKVGAAITAQASGDATVQVLLSGQF